MNEVCDERCVGVPITANLRDVYEQNLQYIILEDHLQ